jgi:hypothetical protein
MINRYPDDAPEKHEAERDLAEHPIRPYPTDRETRERWAQEDPWW